MVTTLFFKICAPQLFKNIRTLFLSLIVISNGMVAMDSKKILAASVGTIIEKKSAISGKKEATALFDCLVEVTGHPYSLGNLELIRLSLKSLKSQLKIDIKKTQDESFLDFFDDVCKAYAYATAACDHVNQSSFQLKNDEKPTLASTPASSTRALSGSPLRKSFTPRETTCLPEESLQQLNRDSIDKKVVIAQDDGNEVHG